MTLRSRPVRFLITRVARAYGFLDPVAVMARLRGFAKPSEVSEPIELLRAGVLFHARGLVNTKAIQNNLDWIWPYWVERQFNPKDASFIPRAFSFSHINLTHRNWTAVGLPDVPFYPIVDPRGLVTPLFDGWSLDFWYLPSTGAPVFPSKETDVEQIWSLQPSAESTEPQLRVCTVVRSEIASGRPVVLATEVSLSLSEGQPVCCIHVSLQGADHGAVGVAVRPYNPEGISTIQEIAVSPDLHAWRINGQIALTFPEAPSRHLLSTYELGDVALRVAEEIAERRVICPVGMATALALFPVRGAAGAAFDVRVPIYDELEPKRRPTLSRTESWRQALAPLAELHGTDDLTQRLYRAALANVVLHAPGEVYPGPYTYKRFWFRDAVFLLNALLALGGVDRTRRALEEFAPRQTRNGYFLSQDGEWDSNGQVLWFLARFLALSGAPTPPTWPKMIESGARWLMRKRLPKGSGKPEAGLLPAGFSAEHLGPNDFYYWDDFWAVAGLRAASELLRSLKPDTAAGCAEEAADLLASIEASFPHGPHRRFPGAIPASPHRRMDSGAIGSLVADYPLQLYPRRHEAILKTADYLCTHHLESGGFFQDMIHSGINAYLTLHLAQVWLRAGEPARAWPLIDAVASLASPTGQWPEAIHPLTFGGCMGDGQHIWAAAEWLMMIRNSFVREEYVGKSNNLSVPPPDSTRPPWPVKPQNGSLGGKLVIGAGVRPEWWRQREVSFGPTLTPYGSLRVRIAAHVHGARVVLEPHWRAGKSPALELRLPACTPVHIPAGADTSDYILPFQP